LKNSLRCNEGRAIADPAFIVFVFLFYTALLAMNTIQPGSQPLRPEFKSLFSSAEQGMTQADNSHVHCI
jgi:hypothetical protein